MPRPAPKTKTVDDYIAGFPADVQRLLTQMRSTIGKAAPGAAEKISYGIPCFAMERILVWYAAHTNHIGFYPGASGIDEFKRELAQYKFAKGSVQFPFDQPLPLALVTRIVKFRLAEIAAKQKKSASKSRKQ